jgi:hypothetical protein
VNAYDGIDSLCSTWLIPRAENAQEGRNPKPPSLYFGELY